MSEHEKNAWDVILSTADRLPEGMNRYLQGYAQALADMNKQAEAPEGGKE